MHPYEMRRLMALRHKDERLELKPGSLYNAASWLVKQSFIEVAGSGRQGRRPKHTIYQITAAGELILKTWVTEILSSPTREASSFAVALDHLVYVPPEAALKALERRQSALVGTIAAMDATVGNLRPRIGRINLIEVEYDLVLARAELAWIETIIDELRSGRLQWRTEEILDAVRQASGKTELSKNGSAASAAGKPPSRPVKQRAARK